MATTAGLCPCHRARADDIALGSVPKIKLTHNQRGGGAFAWAENRYDARKAFPLPEVRFVCFAS